VTTAVWCRYNVLFFNALTSIRRARSAACSCRNPTVPWWPSAVRTGNCRWCRAKSPFSLKTHKSNIYLTTRLHVVFCFRTTGFHWISDNRTLNSYTRVHEIISRSLLYFACWKSRGVTHVERKTKKIIAESKWIFFLLLLNSYFRVSPLDFRTSVYCAIIVLVIIHLIR